MKCKKHSFSLNYKELGEILYFLSSSNYKSSLQNVSLKKIESTIKLGSKILPQQQ